MNHKENGYQGSSIENTRETLLVPVEGRGNATHGGTSSVEKTELNLA